MARAPPRFGIPQYRHAAAKPGLSAKRAANDAAAPRANVNQRGRTSNCVGTHRETTFQNSPCRPTSSQGHEFGLDTPIPILFLCIFFILITAFN
jgi:hypothetical protein